MNDLFKSFEEMLDKQRTKTAKQFILVIFGNFFRNISDRIFENREFELGVSSLGIERDGHKRKTENQKIR